MEWLEISYHATEENYELVSQIFIDAGSEGILLEDSKTPYEIPEDRFGGVYRLNPEDYPSHGVIVKGHFAVNPQVDALLEQVKTKIFELAPAEVSSFMVTIFEEEDWAEAWKSHYKPLWISENLVIKPSWLGSSGDSDVIEILLEPGMAFGTGTHETTRLSLELLNKYVNNTSRVIDVGCGSGILAITASKLGAKSVYGVDLDEMAIIRARENVALNGCSVTLEVNHLMNGVATLAWKPNLIVANILASVIVSMLEDVAEVLNEGDIFICSGIIAEEQGMVVDALTKHQFTIVEILEENGWVAIVGRR